MGKASSSKKVARAAGIGGGRSHRRQTPWAYFGVIVLIVVLGLVGTYASRQQRIDKINAAGATGALAVGTTNYEGYAVYECGKFVTPIKTPAPAGQGITAWTPTSGTAPTDGGVIQIAPTSDAVAGKNATLGKFSAAVGMKLNAAELQVPGGHLYLDGDSCEGKAGHVYIKEFRDGQDSVGQLYNGDKKQLPKTNPIDIPLRAGKLLTIAFVPSGDAASIPAPSLAVANELSAAQSAAQNSTSTATTLPLATTPTSAPSPATTAGSSPSTTTKPTSSTTTAG
jgi:hypothetical protein